MIALRCELGLSTQLRPIHGKKQHFESLFVTSPRLLSIGTRTLGSIRVKAIGEVPLLSPCCHELHLIYFVEFIKFHYLPPARANGLDVLIAGHSHLYQRGAKDGVNYFIIGGGGGVLENERVKDYGIYSKSIVDYHRVIVDLEGCELYWNAFNERDELIDSVILTSHCQEKN